MELPFSENERQRMKEIFSGIKAVIFDMDGLMIDSERIHQLAYNSVLQKFGSSLSEEENAERYVGISDADISVDLVKRKNLPISPEELAKLKEAADLELLPNVASQPGLLDLLIELQQQHMRMAIASSSSLSTIKLVVDSLKVGDFFESYTSAEEVEHGKPAPDLFLLAAQKLSVPPNECLVLEDAPSGIRAAGAAGMRTIAIPSRETMNQDFTGATLRLKSLNQVLGYLHQDLHT